MRQRGNAFGKRAAGITAAVVLAGAVGAAVVAQGAVSGEASGDRPLATQIPSAPEQMRPAGEVTAARAVVHVDAGDVERLRAAPIEVDAADVTVLIDPSAVIDGGDASHPFLVATAAARNLRVMSSVAGRAALVRGFAGGVVAPEAEGCTVVDLAVRACAGPGVRLGNLSRVRGVTAQGCVGDGIRLGHRADVRDARAFGNGGVGIAIGTGSAVRDSTASNNGGDGVRAGHGALVRSVSSVSNIGSGIVASYSTLVDSCVTESNGGDGVSVEDGSTVHATVSNDNADAGVRAGIGCLVRGGSARSNYRAGYVLGRESRLVDCTSSNGFMGVLIASTGVVIEGVSSTGNAFGVVRAEGEASDAILESVSVTNNRVADETAMSTEEIARRLAR